MRGSGHGQRFVDTREKFGPIAAQEIERARQAIEKSAIQTQGQSLDRQRSLAEKLLAEQGRVRELQHEGGIQAGQIKELQIALTDTEKKRREEQIALLVNTALELQGYEGQVWALGDCAAIKTVSGKDVPPTAQHATREATTCATNIVAAIR